MILVMGHVDEHSSRVIDHLKAAGEEVRVWYTREFPVKSQFAVSVDQSPEGVIVLDGERIPLSRLRSVYWYYYHGVAQEPIHPHGPAAEIGLLNFFRCTGCLWVNSPQAVAWHRLKINQLKALKAAGIRVPETLVTNDVEALRAFFDRHDGKIVCKNFTHIGIPQIVTAEDMALLEKQPSLQPAVYQEFVAGRDIRVHAVGDELFPTEIITEDWTFVLDRNLELKRTDLPEDVSDQCRLILSTLGLILSGIDFRRTEAGEYICFEANPSPQFGVYEEACGYPVSKALAQRLIRGNER